MADQATAPAAAAPATAHEDIKAYAKTVLSKIDTHQATRSEVLAWLANDKSDLQSAIQYIERNREALDAKLGGKQQAAAASPAPQLAAPAAQAAAPVPAAAPASTDAPTAETAPTSATAGAASAA
jgi:hypothetical protein